ncbi:MAG: uracil-DNA glycosylase [Dissulfurispiraceae bacterium]
MNEELTENIRAVLELYQAFGFAELPIMIEPGATANPDVPVAKPSGLASGAEAQAPRRSSSDKEAELEAVRTEIGDCRRCKLCQGRTHIVFGEGSVNARLMLIGEAPGREEDIQARPFVGEAGQLLTRLIEKMGFQRSDVYIGNIVKCRPPSNRDPQEDEIATCYPFLCKQIEIISPEVIMSLGRVSGHKLLGITVSMSKFSISRTRGQFYEYGAGSKNIPLMPTFHPAYLLRNPKDKWLTWEDAQAVIKKLTLGDGTS